MHDKSAEAHRVVLLKVKQIPQAAAVLARAFQDDTLQSYVLPDARERVMALPALFNAGIRHGQLAGEVWTTAGEPVGVAVWLRLGQEEMAPDQLEQAGFNELPSIMGADAFAGLTHYKSGSTCRKSSRNARKGVQVSLLFVTTDTFFVSCGELSAYREPNGTPGGVLCPCWTLES
jgi:hypothetical protein